MYQALDIGGVLKQMVYGYSITNFNEPGILESKSLNHTDCIETLKVYNLIKKVLIVHAVSPK